MATLARIQHIPSYVTELRLTSGMYIGWVPQYYADDVTAESYYSIMENDPAVWHALHLLSLMSAGEYVEYISKDKLLKKIVTEGLKHIRDYTHARKSLIEKSVLHGLGVQRKYYKKVRLRCFPGLDWIVPYRMQEVDRRRLRIERHSDNRNLAYWTIWCQEPDQFMILEDRSKNPNAPDGFAVQDFIWFIQMWNELSPYHEGFGQKLFALTYIKSKVLQYWADLCESWSKPFLVALIDTAKATWGAEIGFVSMQQRAQAILDALDKARARHSVVFDKEDKVNFHEHGSTGSNICQELMQYCDKKIHLLILGQELTTGTGTGRGSYALGGIHENKEQTIVGYNRMRCAETLERDLVYDFIFRNRLNLYRLGCVVPEPGDIELEMRVKREKIKEQAMQKYAASTRGNPALKM